MNGTSDPEIVTMGETMALVVPSHGDLRTAADFEVGEAGAESNVAQYLAELGHPVAWVSRLGVDPLGHRVADAVASSGVDMRWVIRDHEAPTGVYFKDPGPSGTSGSVAYYYRSTSAASGIRPDDVERIPWRGVRVAHVTGVTLALSESCAAASARLFERAASVGALRSFDVNHRPALWLSGGAGDTLLDFARRADVVFVGRDEAARLWGTADPDSVRTLVGTGPELVVKDAPETVAAYPRGSHQGVSWAIPPRHVVEPVGAGDAFAAGYLSARMCGDRPVQAVEWGHRVAELALGSVRDHVDARALRRFSLLPGGTR